MPEYTCVGTSVRKIDSLSLATGAARFTDDIAVDSPLYVAFVYSTEAHALVTHIHQEDALAAPGVALVLTHENVPRIYHTTAGQGFPEPSPYDCLMFDRKVRFVGDRIAAVAAETREQALEAASLVRIEYSPMPAVFDPRESEGCGTLLHTDGEHPAIPVHYEPERNIAARLSISIGEESEGYGGADAVVDMEFSTQYASHCAIEPHAVAAVFDEQDRLIVYTSTQVPFHARRIIATVCEIPVRSLRVVKPRIGGGFGGKQEVFLEPVAALVAWRTGRNVRLVLSRSEVFVSARTRHPMVSRIRAAASRADGLTAVELDCLMNAGAYGPHALTVLSNAGAKVLPLFNKARYVRFSGRSVYTNLPVGGAYRGYGATQGYFALNQAVDRLCVELGIDMPAFCREWHIRKGETSEVFKALGEGKEGVVQTVESCGLDECIDRGVKLIGWDGIRGKRLETADGWVRGVGMAVAMQGSAIPRIDMAGAYMKMNDDGSFNLQIGATDLGTGSDTVLAQIAAETLSVPVRRIIVLSSDTDVTPFDTGAYASSTTYLSGNAVKLCAERVADQIRSVAAEILGSGPAEITLEESAARAADGRSVDFGEVCRFALYRENQFQIQAVASATSSVSPPPFIAQFAEVAVDLETGRIRVERFVSVVDCGQAVNPALAGAQVQGGAVNGISYALCEDYRFNAGGRMLNDSFWDYKIFRAIDMPRMETVVIESHEPSGPFGAKSVGEISINGPAPAIANALFDAAGVRITDLPITPQKVWEALRESGKRTNGPR